jgi:hypothetical protein
MLSQPHTVFDSCVQACLCGGMADVPKNEKDAKARVCDPTTQQTDSFVGDY